jgi:hypothetical protein
MKRIISPMNARGVLPVTTKSNPPANKAPDGGVTKRDAGLELVRVADELSKAADELKDWPDLQKSVRAARKVIEEKFYEECMEDVLGFGI